MFPSIPDLPARRALLRGFASGVAALLFVRPASARKELLLKETFVAGTPYYDADRAAPRPCRRRDPGPAPRAE